MNYKHTYELTTEEITKFYRVFNRERPEDQIIMNGLFVPETGKVIFATNQQHEWDHFTAKMFLRGSH